MRKPLNTYRIEFRDGRIVEIRALNRSEAIRIVRESVMNGSYAYIVRVEKVIGLTTSSAD